MTFLADIDFRVLAFLNPSFVEKLRAEELRHWERYIEYVPAVDWDEKMPAPRVHTVLRAATWKPFAPFDEPCESPEGTWTYDTVTLKRAHAIDCLTHRGRKKIVFDGDVEFPRVCEVHDTLAVAVKGKPPRELWMSYTPQEILTQRPGLRKAKGHTIVVGLGMGWLLTRVMQKAPVERVTLVERSQELVDWVLPSLRKHFPDKELEVVVGDGNELVPNMKANVALWDIWEMLGQVDQDDVREMEERCPHIDQTWFWGATAIRPSDYL